MRYIVQSNIPVSIQMITRPENIPQRTYRWHHQQDDEEQQNLIIGQFIDTRPF